MNRLKSFSPINPTGDTPGMEPVRLDVLKAAVNNAGDAQTATPSAPLVSKNIRLPADLVEFVDYVFTKDHRNLFAAIATPSPVQQNPIPRSIC